MIWQSFYQLTQGCTRVLSFPDYRHMSAGANLEARMNLRRRDVPLLMTVLSMISGSMMSFPAVAQTAPAGPATGDTQSVAAIPDFSGIWAHMTWPDFEPPLRGGPGPVKNRSLRNGASDA
jgi:hypothetical protein